MIRPTLAAIALLGLAACTTTPAPPPGVFLVAATNSVAPDAVVRQADTICTGRLNALLFGMTISTAPPLAQQDSVYIGCMAEQGLRFIAF